MLIYFILFNYSVQFRVVFQFEMDDAQQIAACQIVHANRPSTSVEVATELFNEIENKL